jgi:3-hydroxyisobutyrate dehydrogenase
MTERTIAFLGLGIMGAGMAHRLIAAGFDVVVWNRSPDKAAPLAAAGARVAATPAAAAQGAGMVVAMLADDVASRSAWLDADGALAAMAPGAVAVESSTLTVEWVRTLEAEAAAAGIRLLDAPVSGSRQQAEEGSLRFLVGGDADALAQARAALDAMGSEIVHLGPSGSGAVFKLINNFLCGVQVASLAEAVVMIERSGMDAARIVPLLVAGAPGSPIAKLIAPRMLDRDYEPRFFLPLMAKDLGYAQAAFAEQSIDLPSAAAARARFEAAAADHADDDMSAVVEGIRKG